MTYPIASGETVARTEAYTYDPAGNVATFKNRAGNLQTFAYDERNREKSYSWNDNGVTPRRILTYDAASNLTVCNNLNADIQFAYYNDNTLKSQTASTANYNENIDRTVSYTYDADGRRATMEYPSGRTFNFNYTSRGQPYTTYDGTPNYQVSYQYDRSGNRTLRAVNKSQTHSTYASDALNRLTQAQHFLVGSSPTFNYAYNEVSQRKYEQRNAGPADGFGYDLGRAIDLFPAQRGSRQRWSCHRREQPQHF